MDLLKGEWCKKMEKKDMDCIKGEMERAVEESPRLNKPR